MADLATAGPAGLNCLGAAEMRARLDRGETTAEALVSDCLARIDAREPELDAWAFVDPELALAQARACDATAPRGLLHGIPVAIKDNFDTADMPTGYGTSFLDGHRPDTDSEWVAVLRAAGAVILGKARSTEFANPYPTTTKNPHDATRVPGASSSGSAAAVADFMVPLATGSQTGGSVVRPAAFCGVWGYKPTFGAFPSGGVRHAKPSIDTPGLFARTLDDVALMRAATLGTEPAALAWPDAAPPRIGVCRTAYWPQALPETVAAIERAATIFGRAGAAVAEIDLPAEVATAMAEFLVIVATEDARAIAADTDGHFDALNPWTQQSLRRAAGLTVDAYEQARTAAEVARARCDELLVGYDALLTPAVRGVAPDDFHDVETSDSNSVWTHMYVPCLGVPAFTGPHGLPVGIQLVARRGADDRLLAVAGWVTARIADASGALPAPLDAVA